MFRSLRILAFTLIAVGIVVGAEFAQAVAEGFLVPEENQMHSLVNGTRASRGLPGLPSNDALRTIARRQAQTMAVKGYIFHTPDLAQQATSTSIPWVTLGENVGVGPSVDAVQEAFLQSPTHYRNVVEPKFNALGVGATADGRGALFFAQDYGALENVVKSVPAVPAVTAPPRTAPPTPRLPQSSGRQIAPTPAPSVESVRATPHPTPDPGLAEQLNRSLDRFPAPLLWAEALTPLPPEPPAERTAGLRDRPSLAEGLWAMFARFFAKLTVWRQLS